MSHRSPNPSGSQSFRSSPGGWGGSQGQQSHQQGSPSGWESRQDRQSPQQRSSGGWGGSQDRQSPQQRSSGGWGGRQDSQSHQQDSPSGWESRQDRQSPQQRSSGGWGGRQDRQSPPSQMVLDLHAPLPHAMFSKLLAKKISAARNPGTTSIPNAFLFRMSRGGQITSFEWLEQCACQNGMANIAALLLFVFNPSTKMFQEARCLGLEEDQVYLVIPSCIGTSTRRDPNDEWSANGGVRGVGGVNDTQEFGRGTNMGASEMQRSIVAARDIKADPNLMRVPLKTFCDAMAGVGAIPLQVEMDSQCSGHVESAAPSAPSASSASDVPRDCKHGVFCGGQEIGLCKKCDWGE